MLLFDIEANALAIKDTTCIHCIWIYDTETEKYHGFTPDTIPAGVQMLSDATHNGVYIDAFNGFGYDYKVLYWLHGDIFRPNQKFLTDSLLKARLVYSDLFNQLDDKLAATGVLPKNLMGSHSLKAWGYRLGKHKGEYEGGFDYYNQDMYTYCKQDVVVMAALKKLLDKHEWADEAGHPMSLELAIRKIITNQEDYGISFDLAKAEELEATLVSRSQELCQSLKNSFGMFYMPGPVFTPKATSAKTGYTSGCPLTKLNLVEFNPGSRHHIVNRFRWKYKHQFTDLTETGQPKVDESILDKLEYPEAKNLSEYLMLQKRIGAVATGENAWTRLVDRSTMRIHGKVNTQGTPTGRATHSNPNVGQVPSVRAAYGKECRALFKATEGNVLVGADLSGLELRCLAHYMFRYDNGAYRDELLNGDIHSKVQHVVGLPTRDKAKTLSYALIYGAGDAKLGSIINGTREDGAEMRKRYLEGIKGFEQLTIDVQHVAKTRCTIIAPDGRHMPVRAAFSALNTLLQGCGAVVSKQAILEVHKIIRDEFDGYYNRAHQIWWVHDEIAFDTDESIAEDIGKACVRGFERSGLVLKLNCPITGEYKIGNNWAEIH